MTRKMTVLSTVVLTVCVLLSLFGCSVSGPSEDSTSPDTTNMASSNEELIQLTLAELEQYDGKDGNLAYVAVDGVIYDVTNSSAWSDGTHKGYDAGQDLSKKIGSTAHGRSVLDDVPIVGMIVP